MKTCISAIKVHEALEFCGAQVKNLGCRSNLGAGPCTGGMLWSNEVSAKHMFQENRIHDTNSRSTQELKS